MASHLCSLLMICWLLGFSLQASGRLSLKMYPEHYLQINANNTPEVNISCVLRDEAGQPVPLAGCEYRLYYEEFTMQFNEGHASPNYTNTYGRTGKYQGRGLEHGECGLTFGEYKNGYFYILGCRVKPLTGGWQTAAMLLDVDPWTPMQYHLEPGVTLALAGTDVTIRGKAEHELDECRFRLPPVSNTVRLDFDSGPASANHSRGRYHGAGLDKKECGITLHDVQPDSSGFVRGYVGSSTPLCYSSDFIELIVLSAPESPPLLTVLTPGVLQPGYFFEATCLVSNSRPAANITWHVGGDQMTSGVTEDNVLDSTWRWNHDPQTVQSRLRLRVDSSHEGKKLLCRAGHMALPSGFQNSTSYKLRVNGDPCSPNPCRGENTVCLVEGQAAFCDCQAPYIGRPPSCRLECVVNKDCSRYRTCVASRCVDVCLTDTCGQDAECNVEHRTAVCKCPKGFIGDPHVLCEGVCFADTCGQGARCSVRRRKPVCKCPKGLVGDPHVRCKEEDDPNCGLTEHSLGLITGGQDAKKGQFPWHVALYGRLSNGSFAQFCGGTLIKPNVVVTAAHCVYSERLSSVQNASGVTVALGKLDREYNGDPANSGVQTSDVDRIIIYGKYRGSRFNNLFDIALLKLTSPVHMTKTVNVACVEWGVSFLEDDQPNMAGVVGRVSGWGVNTAYTTGPRTLQWIDLPWIDQDSCIRQTEFRHQHFITFDKFCAGFVNETKSVCQGDSGGGYMVQQNGRYYLRGVVSSALTYGDKGCGTEHYTTFTSLSHYTSWVKRDLARIGSQVSP